MRVPRGAEVGGFVVFVGIAPISRCVHTSLHRACQLSAHVLFIGLKSEAKRAVYLWVPQFFKSETHASRARDFSALSGCDHASALPPVRGLTKIGHSILRRQALGFAAIVICVWVAEFTHLPSRFFGGTPEINLLRGGCRSLLIVLIWAWSHFTIRRLVSRVRALEEYLRICAWCRKVDHEGSWLTTEEYFGSHLATLTSHGICPECSSRQHLPPLPDPTAR